MKKSLMHPRSLLANKRNMAKGTVGFILGNIREMDMEALYPKEVLAFQTIQKIAKKLQADWKKEIPI